MKFSNNDLLKLNPYGFTRISKAFSLFDLSPSTGYRLIKKGKFPKQVKISEGVSSMRNCDLLKYSADPEKYSAGE